MTRLPYLALLFVTACAADPADQLAGGGGGGKADGETSSISFHGDYTQTVDGTLLAGTSVRVSYDLSRLRDCVAESNGSEAWGVTGWAQFDTGAPVSFAVSQLAQSHVAPVSADLPLPASATHVAIWFETTNIYGCHAYDSAFGANYNFTIDRHGIGAVLSFDAQWNESASGAIHTGDRVVVHYEPERLAQCAGSQAGHAAWGITAHWQVDGGTVHDVMATRADADSLVAADPEITIPHGHDLALWFEATSIWGCHAYDSASGANYHFAID